MASAQISTPRRGVWGWMLFDWAAQPFFTVVTTFIFGPYFVSRMASDPATGQAVFVLPASGWRVDPNFPNPYTEQYSVSVQRQLAQDFGLEISYIGNVGRKIPRIYQYNPAVYGPGATLANTEQRRRYYPGQIGGMFSS